MYVLAFYNLLLAMINIYFVFNNKIIKNSNKTVKA